MNHKLMLATAAIGVLTLSGCATTLTNDRPGLDRRAITDVDTDYSLGLSCLGKRIDRTRKAPIMVYVDHIDDLTVPERYDGRRLSSGGKWWLHTAINKIGSRRVQAVTASTTKADRGNPNHLVLTGAWTQDDQEVGRTGAMFDALLSDFGINIGGRESFDVIAGDFVSSRQGRVVHASAISVAVSSRNAGFNLQVEDGDREFGLDFSRSAKEGPQFAQRRIAEAAVMVHIARAFDVDYRPCIEPGGDPAGS